MVNDELFMRRAMDLAMLGLGSVSPNPLVGCVIVVDGKIVGEGWHRKYGEAHAEVNAIESVKDRALLSNATVYVNLEPCSHVGKTPPCADKLIEVGVKRVVVSNRDTNPLVSGKGMEKLKSAGIAGIDGVLEEEGRKLNRRFFTAVEQKIPFTILKWAESADGFIAAEKGKSSWISNTYSRQRVHQWRAEEDAVLVGTRTAEVDNPRLNVREWTGRNPCRVVIDRSLRLSSTLHLFDQSQPTTCYNLLREEKRDNLQFVKLNAENFISDLLRDLAKRGVQSLIVEGGAQTLNAFIAGGWWHEARIFRGSQVIGSGVAAPSLRGKLVHEDQVVEDRLSILVNSAHFKT